MKKLLLACVLLSACGETKIDYSEVKKSGVSLEVQSTFWSVYKVEIDSVQYLVANCGKGISIIKHEKK